VLIIDIKNLEELTTNNLKKADVAFDFSTPQSAYSNIMKCFTADIPVVCGTTGWLTKFDEVLDFCRKNNKTFFYAPNYSIGVNVLFAINLRLAEMMNRFSEYDVTIEEIHHTHKLDAPSGTAIAIANDIISKLNRKDNWTLGTKQNNDTISIRAIRENEVPGTHTITYDSTIDSIELKHTAKNRKGLALGAILAAEFILNKTGYYTMNDLMNAEP
jgi:4-hydroxy-tetrahydrodipicolinate reductase